MSSPDERETRLLVCPPKPTAFYVDNGKQLPVWKEFPHFTYWLLPLAVGIPLIVRALLWHKLARQTP